MNTEAIRRSSSFLSTFSSNRLKTSSRVMGAVSGLPPFCPLILPLEDRLSKLPRRS